MLCATTNHLHPIRTNVWMDCRPRHWNSIMKEVSDRRPTCVNTDCQEDAAKKIEILKETAHSAFILTWTYFCDTRTKTFLVRGIDISSTACRCYKYEYQDYIASWPHHLWAENAFLDIETVQTWKRCIAWQPKQRTIQKSTGDIHHNYLDTRLLHQLGLLFVGYR